jgi:hypothetical protein
VSRESNLKICLAPSSKQLKHLCFSVGIISPTGWSAPMTQNIYANLNVNQQ